MHDIAVAGIVDLGVSFDHFAAAARGGWSVERTMVNLSSSASCELVAGEAPRQDLGCSTSTLYCGEWGVSNHSPTWAKLHWQSLVGYVACHPHNTPHATIV
jgi:hypothetical protein